MKNLISGIKPFSGQFWSQLRKRLSFSRLIRAYFFLLFLAAFALILISLSGTIRFDFFVAGDPPEIVSEPGDWEVWQNAQYFLSLPPGPENAWEVQDWLPKKLNQALEGVRSRARLFFFLKIIFLVLILGALLTLISRAWHGRVFLPLFGVVTLLVLGMGYLRVYWDAIHLPFGREAYINFWEMQDTEKYRHWLHLHYGILTFLGVNILFTLGLLFSRKFAALFPRFHLDPLLLPLENRTDYELRQMRGQRVLIQERHPVRSALEILFHFSLIVLFGLLVGNLIYMPLFLAQVKMPGLTFLIFVGLLVLMQIFYLNGYARVLRENLRRRDGEKTGWLVAWLVAYSFLCFRAIRNISRVGFVIFGSVMFITAILLLILSNLNIADQAIGLFPRSSGF